VDIVSPNKTKTDKIFEKVPPMITWLVIIFPIAGSLFIPEVVAIFILVFNVFFFYRSMAFSAQFLLGLIKIRSAKQVNWQAKVEGLDDIKGEISKLEGSREQIKSLVFKDEFFKQVKSNNGFGKALLKLPKVFQKIIFFWSKFKTKNYINGEIENLKEIRKMDLFSYKEINHVIIIPHYKEPVEVLDDTLERLSVSSFPKKQIHVVLGAEARDSEGLSKSEKLRKKYGEIFGNIWVSNHVLTEHEIVGKSSNMAACGRVVYEEIKKLGWDLKRTTVTSCDADSQLPQEYFSYLTYKFITTADRHFKFYTGAVLLYANIWRLDFLARVRNSLSTMYNVGKLVRPDKFIPFSTYSTSFWLVKQVGFWTPWITPEDFHIFFKTSFYFPKKVSTIPLFCKIMVDAAEGVNTIDTFKNNYYQSRRWQWGVSDDGWVLKNLVKRIGKLPFIVYYRGLHVMLDHILAPTSSFLIMLGANLPPIINPRFASTVFGARLPGISSTIVQLTLAAFMVAIIADIFLKPKRDGVSLFKKLTTPLEWFLNPIVGFLLTSIPGLEAHTRLLFGKYLEYYATKKRA